MFLMHLKTSEMCGKAVSQRNSWFYVPDACKDAFIDPRRCVSKAVPKIWLFFKLMYQTSSKRDVRICVQEEDA